MILWLDAQVSPHLATWIIEALGIETRPIRDVSLRDSKDQEIFLAARDAGAVVMTKDSDFLFLLEQHGGPPPHALWITCGNTSNVYLKALLERTLPAAMNLLEQGDPLVEISDPMR